MQIEKQQTDTDDSPTIGELCVASGTPVKENEARKPILLINAKYL